MSSYFTDKDKFQIFRSLEALLFAATTGMIFLAIYWVFQVVPDEAQMGAVQRIFYFHVGSAIACYLACFVLFVAALGFFATRNSNFDCINEAASEVGLVLASCVLSSGMIWGRYAWNTWFSWEPRLVSFLVLWLMLIALVLLRKFGDASRIAAHCAILALASAVLVPIVVYSIKILPHIAQLHPVVVEKQGLKDVRFSYALAITTFAMILFQFLLILIRTRLAHIQRRVREYGYSI